MQAVCVYLGTDFGDNDSFKESVILLGQKIAKLGLTLVYGGSSVGMMGLLATIVKESGGKVIGIITKYLITQEKPLEILDELHIVDSMQDRKKMMQNLADFFIVMPGGLGTIEEAVETWNANKIGEINKKIGFLNTDGFFDELFNFVNSCQKRGFLTKSQANIPLIADDVCLLLDILISDDI